MWRAQIMTKWTVINGRNLPEINDMMGKSDGWNDVTGQLVENITPDPNAYTVECVVEKSTLDAIAADGRFIILWQEEVIENVT